MKTRVFISIILCFLMAQLVNAQFNDSSLKADFQEYIDAIINKEFQKSTDYIADEFFQLFTKEQLVQLMEQTFNDPTVEFEITDFKILNTKYIGKVEGRYFASLNYTNTMKMKFLDFDNSDSSEKDDSNQDNLIKSSLELSFGEENVKYDEETNIFEITAFESVCCIAKLVDGPWKFIVMKEDQKPYMEKILPKEILDKF